MELKHKVETNKADSAGIDLCNAKLMRADLSKGDFRGADFSSAYLLRTNFQGAKLCDVDFTGAIMSEANLSNTDLEGAEFTDAYLCGTDFSGAINLTCDQIDLATLDKDTRLPDYIKIEWTSDTTWECIDDD